MFHGSLFSAYWPENTKAFCFLLSRYDFCFHLAPSTSFPHRKSEEACSHMYNAQKYRLSLPKYKHVPKLPLVRELQVSCNNNSHSLAPSVFRYSFVPLRYRGGIGCDWTTPPFYILLYIIHIQVCVKITVTYIIVTVFVFSFNFSIAKGVWSQKQSVSQPEPRQEIEDTQHQNFSLSKIQHRV